jgi:hypothetical protein
MQDLQERTEQVKPDQSRFSAFPPVVERHMHCRSCEARYRHPSGRGEREKSMSPLRRFLSWSFGWLIAGPWFLFRALLIAWATLAIYYSNLP